MMSNLVPLDAEAGGRRQHRTASRTTGMSSRKARRSDLEGNSQVDALTAGIKLHDQTKSTRAGRDVERPSSATSASWTRCARRDLSMSASVSREPVRGRDKGRCPRVSRTVVGRLPRASMTRTDFTRLPCRCVRASLFTDVHVSDCGRFRHMTRYGIHNERDNCPTALPHAVHGCNKCACTGPSGQTRPVQDSQVNWRPTQQVDMATLPHRARQRTGSSLKRA